MFYDDRILIILNLKAKLKTVTKSRTMRKLEFFLWFRSSFKVLTDDY